MGFECLCPNPTELPDLTLSNCPFNIKQLQRVIGQRGGYQFDGTPGNDITLLADWQALQVAADDTKVVAAPLFGGDPVVTAGEPLTTGGNDNTTLNGVPEVNGVGPSVFTATYKNITPAEKAALQAWFCELDFVVYFVNQDGNFVVREVSAGTYEGFEVYGRFFVGDRNNEGFAGNDTFACQFSMKPGWDDDLVIVEPTFNPLKDL